MVKKNRSTLIHRNIRCNNNYDIIVYCQRYRQGRTSVKISFMSKYSLLKVCLVWCCLVIKVTLIGACQKYIDLMLVENTVRGQTVGLKITARWCLTVFETFSLGKMDLREEKYTKWLRVQVLQIQTLDTDLKKTLRWHRFENTLDGYEFDKYSEGKHISKLHWGDTGLKIQLMDIILTNTVSRFRES